MFKFLIIKSNKLEIWLGYVCILQKLVKAIVKLKVEKNSPRNLKYFVKFQVKKNLLESLIHPQHQNSYPCFNFSGKFFSKLSELKTVYTRGSNWDFKAK